MLCVSSSGRAHIKRAHHDIHFLHHHAGDALDFRLDHFLRLMDQRRDVLAVTQHYLQRNLDALVLVAVFQMMNTDMRDLVDIINTSLSFSI